MSVDGLPLKLGDRGPMVRDLHARLAQADSPVGSAGDVFTNDTVEAVIAFQRSRRLEVDGLCGHHTWNALAEAAHRLGDRLLYLQSPMLRGDDVADLQQRLGALGFDAGRVDGIFGPDTAHALQTFQRNAGLPTDGISGPETVASLGRLGARDHHQSVTAVRERERLRSQSSPAHSRRLVIGEYGGLGTIADTFARDLRSDVRVDVVAHPDGSHHARVCNQIDADAYLGLISDNKARCAISYFATTGFISEGGSHLAALLADAYAELLDVPIEITGKRLPVLRETKMPAVVVRLGPTQVMAENAPGLAVATRHAFATWLAQPVAELEVADDRVDAAS